MTRIEDTEAARDMLRAYLFSAAMTVGAFDRYYAEQTGEETNPRSLAGASARLDPRDKMILISVVQQLCDAMPPIDVQRITATWGWTPRTVRKRIRHMVADLEEADDRG